MTQETEYTPGPWHIFDDGGENYGIVRYEDGNAVATPDGCAMDGGVVLTSCEIRNKADARLIAAAPELLEALEAVIEIKAGQIMPNGHVYKKCIDAINKARGAP
jgi:hypothetical protein